MTKCEKRFGKHTLYHVSNDNDKLLGIFCDRCLSKYLYKNNPNNPMIAYYLQKAKDYPSRSCPDKVKKLL